MLLMPSEKKQKNSLDSRLWIMLEAEHKFSIDGIFLRN